MSWHRGRSLVELIVIVMIVGILAAVLFPLLDDRTGGAGDGVAKETLDAVREAIERFAADHRGTLPAADGSEQTLRAELRPYLGREFPRCPVGPQAARNNEVRVTTAPGAIAGEANPTKGWHYSNQSGDFIINSCHPTEIDQRIRYDDL
jgi:type II secretory pathway pseudopilin PulG